MSVALTYPGVYVEELPSGVHTITGGQSRNGPASFANLSRSPSAPLYMVAAVDADSQYVTVVNPAAPTATITPPTSISASTIPAPTGLAVTSQSGGSLPASTTFF